MSSTIDWSKAPEGATHYVQGSIAPWEKRDGDDWYYFRNRDRSWTKLIGPDMHGERRIEVAKLTIVERPTEPQEPTPWNGEGLPPVGTVCEFRWGVAAWKRCTVFAHRPNANGGIDALVDIECDWTFSSSPTRFRPIKSAEQIAAEERGAAINEMVNVWRRTMGRFAVEEHGLAEMLYDAGYRKVEQP